MLHRITNPYFFLVLAFVLVITLKTVEGQTLDKLAQMNDFVPSARTTEARLIELARHYKMPMGIEWMSDGNEAARPSPLIAQPTVREMLNSILRDAPGYRIEVKDGVLSIGKAPWSEDPRNFLNLQLIEYRIEKGNVIHAEAALRFQIHSRLHPEKYLTGYNGGYGYGEISESFSVKNISITGQDITVRQVLNSIIRQNGDAFWVVELLPSRTLKNEPYFATGSSTTGAGTDFS
jgi:hypothetical protein